MSDKPLTLEKKSRLRSVLERVKDKLAGAGDERDAVEKASDATVVDEAKKARRRQAFARDLDDVNEATKKNHRQLIALDLDGVVNEYKGWNKDNGEISPLKGVARAIERFREAGFSVCIFTARTNIHTVQRLLREQGIRITVHHEKPPAAIYVDDRGFRFEGRWDDVTVERVIRMAKEGPWWEQGDKND